MLLVDPELARPWSVVADGAMTCQTGGTDRQFFPPRGALAQGCLTRRCSAWQLCGPLPNGWVWSATKVSAPAHRHSGRGTSARL